MTHARAVRTAVALTAMGAALLIGSANTQAAAPPVQTFPTAGLYAVNWDICYGGNLPVRSGAALVCGPGTGAGGIVSSSTSAPLGVGATALRSYAFIDVPAGDRGASVVTYTPGAWGVDPTKTGTCAADANNDCASATETGSVTFRIDAFCSDPAFDIVAPSKTGFPITWPDDPADGIGWLPYAITRVADAVAGPPIASSPNAYVESIKPFPLSFAFDALDRATADTLFSGGFGGAFAIIPQSHITYSAFSPYRAGLRVSFERGGSDPRTPPINDYTCRDTPQDDVRTIEYMVPPTTPGLYPRWAALTSNPDITSGDVARILDTQCVNVGSFAGADTDADCLPDSAEPGTACPAGNASATLNPDCDADGLPDGIESTAGSEVTIADADADGANDYVEMFQFTDTHVADTDGDGSRDLQDNGADEDAGNNLYIADTITDDNCPAFANADQLNTDALNEYHGGVTSGAAPLGTGAPATVITASSAATATTTFTVTGSGFAFAANQFVTIAGAIGSSAATPSQDQLMRTAVNGVQKVEASPAPASSSFTFKVAGANAAPGPVTVGTSATGAFITRPTTGDLNTFGQYGATNPAQDALGDACDPDDDNDGLDDIAEPATKIVPWSGPGANTEPADPPLFVLFRGTVCRPATYYAGFFAGDTLHLGPSVALNPRNGDSDGDLVLDGIECRQGSRPDVADKRANALIANDGKAECGTIASHDPDGCAQPKPAATGEDPDKDDLYFSSNSSSHGAVEDFYRTQSVDLNGAPRAMDLDCDGLFGAADKDSDADWNAVAAVSYPCGATQDTASILPDGLEVRFYGTAPSNADSDGDGCDDAREVTDVNGDRVVNSGDVTALSIALTALDPDGDGVVNPLFVNRDINKDRVINSGDKAFVTTVQSKSAGLNVCSSRQLGKVATGAAK